MKRFLFSISVFAAILCCSLTTVLGQTWQNTVGTAGSDLHWQGLANSAGYITVGHTTATAASVNTNIILTQFDNNGAVLWSRIVSMASGTTTNYHFQARDISEAPAYADPVTGATMAAGYYITGVAQNTTPNVGTNMFVLRVDAAGAVVWLRLNVLPTLNMTQSEGISVVTLSSGGVIAVGNVLMSNTAGAAPVNQVIAARLLPTGGLVWSNVYFNIATATNTAATMTAHEATRDPNMVSCSPTAPTVAENGVVVTGEIANSISLANFGAGPHLFAMFIDASGTECWRNAYPVHNSSPASTQSASAGHDITHEPSTNSYIIVGRAYNATTSPTQNTTYIVRTTAAGAFLCGSLVNISSASGGATTVCNAFARSVVTSNTPGTTGIIAVAGLNLTTNASYLMTLPAISTVCPQTPNWVKEYLLPPAPAPTAVWTPVPGISGNGVPESLVLAGTSMNTFNYFMTTNTASNTVAGAFDMHVIRTDVNGLTQTACPPQERTSSATSTGVLIDLTETQTADNSWTSVNAAGTNVQLQQNLCSTTCTVTAGFTATAAAGTCSYTFTNTSTGNGTLSYSWTFGDPNSGANNTSTATNPSHVFSASGSYNVCLVATNTLANGTTCTNTHCQTIQVSCPTPCTVTAGFAMTSATGSCTYAFASNSTGNGTLSYSWNFGDPNSGANNTATTANATHTFSATGSYSVCLTVTNTLSNGTTCTNTHCQTIQATCATNCTVTAGYTVPTPTPNSYCTYNFVNSSTGNGALTYSWNFGDPGSGANNTSTATNPTHTFSASGAFNVCLTATNTLSTGVSCTNTYCQTIQAYCPSTCTVNTEFCHTINGFQVSLTNSSSGNGTVSYNWSFGDGTGSTAANPIKTYSAAGTYTVCLTTLNTLADGTQCCKTCCKTIVINPVCSVNSNFRHCVNGNQVALTNLSTTGVTYSWTLNSNALPFSTAYTPPTQILPVGTHVICLEASRTVVGGSCSKFTCKTVVIDATCSVLARFSHNTCLNSLSATFNNTSVGATSYTWHFGDPNSGANNTSTATSPSHTFSAHGTYVVCLTAQSSATCRYRVCQTVQVAQPNCTTSCPQLCATCPMATDESGEGTINHEEPAAKSGLDGSEETKDFLNDGSDIQVFPNPATNDVQVVYNAGDSKATVLKVSDLQGKIIQEILLDENQQSLDVDLSRVPAGMYMIAIHHENGTISGAKLMKE